MGIISDQTLRERAEEEGITLTDDPEESIFILRDGTGISGDFDMGIRGTDHNTITGLVEPEIDQNDNEFWARVHATTGVLRLVPETSTAMIMEGQQLTTAQQNAIESVNATVQEYVEQPTVEQVPATKTTETMRQRRLQAVRSRGLELS